MAFTFESEIAANVLTTEDGGGDGDMQASDEDDDNASRLVSNYCVCILTFTLYRCLV